MKQKFDVKGMSCSACALGIEKSLKGLDGVKTVEVSLIAESMTVDFDEGVLSVQDVCDVVNKLGYRASQYGAEKKADKSAHAVPIRFFVSLALLLPIMYLSMGGMLGFPLPSKTVSYAVQLVLTVIILAVNHKFFVVGTRAVISRAPNMDTLVALSAGASFLFSLVASILYFSGANSTSHMFYESAAMVVTLVTLGKMLEDKSKRRTGREIEKLSKLVPKTVTIIEDGKDRTVDTSEVREGDLLLFRAGDYVAVDGVVSEGSAFVDKAAITGESLPVEVSCGQEVVSGSIVKSGYIVAVAKRVGADTLFSKIIEAVRTAGASKAPVQKFADKVAGVFVPVVAMIAVITFVVWISITRDVYSSFNFAISVLVISCPCALGLATPVAIMATTGKAASLGILYKDAEAIQKAQDVTTLLLDKTATITEGTPRVVSAEFLVDEKRAKEIASAVEAKSTHPLATCIREYAGESALRCEHFDYVVGEGATAEIEGQKYYLGNAKLVSPICGVQIAETQDNHSKMGYTTVFLANATELLAVFAIADTVKSDSTTAVAAMGNFGLHVVMVSGDNAGAASQIAKEVGLDDYVSDVLPAGKLDVVKQYQSQNEIVAMVGDGINDSPAIKAADVGIAVGTGTDVAIDSADVVLAGGSLKGVLDAITLSKKSNQIIKGNLFWAFFYNVIAIPVAAGALSPAGVTLTPSIAAACMCLSSLFVVLNALRITRFRSNFERMGGDEPLSEKPDTEITAAPKDGKGEIEMKTVYVDGMMCMHCVKHVTDALMRLDGVSDVKIDLATKKVDISLDASVNDEDVKRAIADAGYEVIG